MSIITPFETGVKSAGGGYHPKFKATGGLIVEPQPEAKTPAVKTSYFTTTHKLRNRKNFIYSQPEFENVRRKPGDPYPSSKPSFHGNLAGGGIDWKNPNIDQYRETANATENRMIIDGQQKGERFPIQWLKPEHINFSGKANEALFAYKSSMSADYMRDKVEQLRQKGYSEDEINNAIAKLREKDIETEVKRPYRPTVGDALASLESKGSTQYTPYSSFSAFHQSVPDAKNQALVARMNGKTEGKKRLNRFSEGFPAPRAGVGEIVNTLVPKRRTYG